MEDRQKSILAVVAKVTLMFRSGLGESACFSLIVTFDTANSLAVLACRESPRRVTAQPQKLDHFLLSHAIQK
jgi:hypothetical protein